jgi:breast cancer 2 susceptibility protein
VTSGNAEMRLFHDESDDDGMGVEAFLHLLAYHGASMHFGSKRYLLLS